MKTKKIIIGGIIIIVLICLGLVIRSWAQKPLSGSSIEALKSQINRVVTPDPGIKPQFTLESLAEDGDQSTGTIEPLPTLIPTLTFNEKPVCGGPPVQLILALGVEDNDQSDAIRLVRVDYINKWVTIMSVPRDLWVDVPNMAEHGITQGRINATFGYGDYFWGNGNGIVLITDTFRQNFEIEFDRYAVLKFRGFIKAVDTLGGVDINLESPVDGRLQGLPYFGQGQHHLDGKNTLSFVRIRFQDTDVHRVNRQTQVLKLLFARAMEPENLKKLPGLVVDLQKEAASTDLTPAEISNLLCLARTLDDSTIIFYDIPQTMLIPKLTEEGGSIRLPRPEVKIYLQNFVNGTLPLPGQ